MKQYFVRRVTYVGEPCEGRREEILKKFETFQEAFDYLEPYGGVLSEDGVGFAISKVRYVGDMRVYYMASRF